MRENLNLQGLLSRAMLARLTSTPGDCFTVAPPAANPLIMEDLYDYELNTMQQHRDCFYKFLLEYLYSREQAMVLTEFSGRSHSRSDIGRLNIEWRPHFFVGDHAFFFEREPNLNNIKKSLSQTEDASTGLGVLVDDGLTNKLVHGGEQPHGEIARLAGVADFFFVLAYDGAGYIMWSPLSK